MRLPLALLVGLSISACSSAPPLGSSDDPPVETGPRWITIDRDALDTVREAVALRVPDAVVEPRELVGDVAVLEIDAQDFHTLSQLMHVNHNRCGGFAAHDSFEQALGDVRAKDHESLVPLISYTIDNAATVQGALAQLSQPTLLDTIVQLSAFTNRYYTSTTGAQASDWLRDRWLGYAAGHAGVTVEQFTHPTWAQKSVIATIPGTDLANEVVIIGGHLDSISPGMPTGRAPGSDDDASGVATLGEMYRALLAADFRPRRTVKFMAYAAEEVGLRGSAAIATQYQANAVNVVGVVQFDMTNYKGSTGDIYLFQDYTNAAQNTFLSNLITAYLPGIAQGTDSCGYACSDHASWHNRGYVTSMPFESRMSQYNPTIHTVNDTLAQSGNNANHAFKFARLGVAYVAELAKGTLGPSTNTPPTVSISAPTNGQTFPQSSPVQLTGTASDAEDGSISASIRWTSSIDGALGTGASRSVTLSAGNHTITAAVTDSGGASASASVSITVTGTTPTDLFRDDFEGTTSWSPTGLWHAANNSTCASPGYSSPTHAMYFGQDSTCNYQNGARVQGTITSPSISGVVSTSALRFKYFRRVESASGGYDVASVEVVRGTTATTVWTRNSTNPSTTTWQDSGAISLSAFAGSAIQLRFRFDSRDSVANNFTGWLVDDVVVTR